MIVEEYIEMNVFESESKKWIAVIKGTEAMLYFSLFTRSRYEIIEAESKEELLEALKKRNLTVVDRFTRDKK